jgi:tRNA(Ile2) C34 agmatinyltransferase TiaS
MANPLCPICGQPMSRNGKNTTGEQTYRCRRDRKVITEGDRPVGRQLIGDRKLSQSELTQRWKENDPEGYKASQARRNKKRRKN